MRGCSEELRSVDIIENISNIIGNSGTQKIITYFNENKTEEIQVTELAGKISTTTTAVNKAIKPLIEKNLIKSTTKGKKKYYSWNRESKEGKILLDLFQPIKNVDEFYETLGRFCDQFLENEFGEDMKFSEYLSNLKELEEQILKLDEELSKIKSEKSKVRRKKRRLKKEEPEENVFEIDLDEEFKKSRKSKDFIGKKQPSRKLLGLLKLRSLFKITPMDSDAEYEDWDKTKVIKPEVMTIPVVGEAVALQLPGPQECGVCQGEIEAGETFIRCSCELITHVGCVNVDQICPQCGKELDLELLLSESEMNKSGVKKPSIREEKKREIEELLPPSTSYFAYIPKITKEENIKKFVRTYYRKGEMGKSTRTKNISDIDLFISIKAAKKMLQHCYILGREKEVMGLILGETYQYNNNLFSIAKDVATSELDATEINVKFMAFEQLFEQLGELQYDYQIVGWYHSHPNYSSFMSPTDIDTQKRMFKHPYQRAIVIDPIKFDMKAFMLDQETMERVKESGYAIIDFKD